MQKSKQNIEGIYDWEMKIGIWCMNPRVAFSPIARKSRNIILTSGTLSPLNALASELSANFPIQVELGHVISPEQVFVGLQTHHEGNVLDVSFKSIDGLAVAILHFISSNLFIV